MRLDAGHFREEPGAGNPPARIREGEAEWQSYSTASNSVLDVDQRPTANHQLRRDLRLHSRQSRLQFRVVPVRLRVRRAIQGGRRHTGLSLADYGHRRARAGVRTFVAELANSFLRRRRHCSGPVRSSFPAAYEARRRPSRVAAPPELRADLRLRRSTRACRIRPECSRINPRRRASRRIPTHDRRGLRRRE